MMSLANIANLYNKFNKMYFNDELPVPDKFDYLKSKRVNGNFSWHGRFVNNGTSVLKLSNYYDMSDFDVEMVLIHEMIHVWQWYHGYNDHHGASFKRMAAKLNAMTDNKYKIQRCNNLSPETYKTRVVNKPVVVKRVITYKKNGKDFVSVIATPKSYSTIIEWLPGTNGICDVRAFDVKSPMFDKFTKSVKTVHGYPYNESEFKQTIIREIKIAI